MGVIGRVTLSGDGGGDKSVKKSPLREIASIGLKGILEDVTGTGEFLQSVDELLEPGNPRTVLEEGFDIQHKPRDPQDEKQAMDTSNPRHLQSPTREKTMEAAEEDTVLSLEDLAAASEMQQSDERIINDLKRKWPNSTEINSTAMGVVGRVALSGDGGGDKSVKKSPLREIASIGLKGILEDVTGTGEFLQSVDELLEPGNPRTVLEEGFDIQHKPRDLQGEKQAMDTSNPRHLQSPTREKTMEAAEEYKVLSLEDLAAASEMQQSDEKIIDDLKRKVEGLSSENSQLHVELDEMDHEDREENRKADSVMEELAKFATPEQTSLVEAKHLNLLGWLQKTLLELQHAKTVAQGQNSYLNRRIRGKDNECLFLGSEFEDFKVESSAEVNDMEVKASKQDEQIYSLRKIKSELDEMLVGCKTEKVERMEKLRVKVVEGFENFDKCSESMRLLEDKSMQRIRSIEAKIDSHGERFEVLDYVFGRANDSFLEELFACTKELQMEKAKERPPHLEKDSLMIENDNLIAQFLYMDMVVLTLERGVLEISEEFRRAARHLCGAIQDYREQCNRLLRNHEAAL